MISSLTIVYSYSRLNLANSFNHDSDYDLISEITHISCEVQSMIDSNINWIFNDIFPTSLSACCWNEQNGFNFKEQSVITNGFYFMTDWDSGSSLLKNVMYFYNSKQNV